MIGRQSKIIKKYEYLIFTITIYCHSENSNNIFDTNGISLFGDIVYFYFFILYLHFLCIKLSELLEDVLFETMINE